ncbi:CE1759 family FMN reductase [Amycolatopsis nalaikhensis]|uniref:NAD(P)H-dependent oxidoreductase n=1 Tax=Amycolatopsis nalaikhensis TaxID=715472 RepID=A0ABY8XRB1_9PSEU|nr:CE1759 family FMN reductase [Amycolatopsis sp. 2-2]WIV58209.1 NAD(P)H-dependent oxidoreductase [Amycolatopsis sp. 2-2]
MKLAVVTAGLSVPSSTRLLADRLAAATVAAAGDAVEVSVVELRDVALDVTKNLLTGFPSPELRAAIETVTGADALVVVTPVFTAGYSGLFKSFFDVLDADSLVGKPVLLGATGGTERHSLVIDYQLRPLFAYLKADPVATGVYAASSDWGSNEGGLQRRIEKAGAELAALAAGRVAAPVEPDFIPFDQLLASTGE